MNRYERVYGAEMMLAGVSVSDRLVLVLAGKLRDAGFNVTAERLETAYDRETVIFGLSVPARESILRVLQDGPEDLAELRGVLLAEHEWRVREGLV